MKKSVVIVDDHLLIARALSSIIDQFDNFHVLYETENGKLLTERFVTETNVPDIVLLDINMPVMDGYTTAAWLTEHHPTVRILALSMQDQEEALLKIIRNGARGYLLKNTHPSELEQALTAIATKGYYYPDWVTHKMLNRLGDDKPAPAIAAISERERMFLQYAASDLTYKEIGDKMFCSGRTIEGYRDNLFEKFGVKSRVGLVLYALKNKLITI